MQTVIDDKAKSLMNRRFQVVAGKGGVGRTLVASALALRMAKFGRKTLLLEVNAPDHCARALGVQGVQDVNIVFPQENNRVSQQIEIPLKKIQSFVKNTQVFHDFPKFPARKSMFSYK